MVALRNATGIAWIFGDNSGNISAPIRNLTIPQMSITLILF